MKNNIIDRFHDYQTRAMRTMSPKEPRLMSGELQQLLHSSLGLSGEIGEIASAYDDINKIEEIGDACWYVAAGADALGHDMEDIEFDSENAENHVEDLQAYCSTISDHVKRAIYYNAGIDDTQLMELFGRALVCLNYYASECGVTLHECMDRNIEKLKIRYPTRFTEEQALRRDTRKEREALES